MSAAYYKALGTHEQWRVLNYTPTQLGHDVCSLIRNPENARAVVCT
jgi:hypothetical protein